MESPEQKRSRLDPEPVPRRDLLGLASLWATATAFAVSLLGMLRLPRAAVLPSPTKGFNVQLPENLAVGEAFVPPGRSVAMFRDGGGVYAVSTICTHLGCVVKPNAEGFECPCHGSRFAKDGEVTKGPAPRALDWLKVTKTDGTWFVDEDSIVPQGRREQA